MFWRWKEEVRDLHRFEEIAQALVSFELGSVLHHAHIKRVKGSPSISQLNSHTLNAQRMRALFEHLGGTFIKLGQLLSVRPDLIPVEYCNEFARLQDHVEELPFPAIEAALEQAWKKPVKDVCASIDRVPLASASVAQVHVATLHGGKKVAIKVQRPGIAELFSSDLDILAYFARKINEHLKPSVFDPVQIVEEFATYTRSELDFLQEAKNIDIFAANFSASKSVRIPRVAYEHTTSKVLVMEYMDGEELRKILGSSVARRRRVVKRIAQAVLKQIFYDGVFHADPHPGNILVLPHDRVAFVDFGIVGRIDDRLRNQLQDLFIGLIRKDLPTISKSLIRLGFAPGDVDEMRLEEDLHLALGKYYDTTIDKIDIGELFYSCLNVAKTHKIKLPRNFVLLGKSLVTLEGLGAEFDPGFNLVRIARPFVEELTHERLHQALKPQRLLAQAYKDSSSLIAFVRSLPDKADRVMLEMDHHDEATREIASDLRALTSNLTTAVTRLVFGLIVIDLLIVASFLWSTPPMHPAGVSYWSLYALLTAAFFLILFFLLSHEEKRRILKADS